MNVKDQFQYLIFIYRILNFLKKEIRYFVIRYWVLFSLLFRLINIIKRDFIGNLEKVKKDNMKKKFII